MARFADSNRTSILLLPEDPNGFGITPANGKPRALRHTGSKVAPKKDNKTSEEIRSDRMVPNIIETGASVDGDVNGERSLFTHDALREALVYGKYSRPMDGDRWRGAHVSVTAPGVVTVQGEDLRPYLTVGRRAKIEGFIDEANNRYVQISAVAFDAVNNVSTITVTPANLVVEAGSKFTSFADANDVIVLNNAAVRAGTAGESAFDSNGTNAFAAAIATRNLRVGQIVFVEGLGAGSGTFTFNDQPAAGETVSVSDGKRAVSFQIGGNLAPGYTFVELGADADASAANLAAAIRAANVDGRIDLTASVAAEVVTVRNPYGNDGVLSSASANVVAVSFAGGVGTARGFFRVTALTQDKISVSPNPGTALNAGPVTIKGSMLRNPGAVAEFVPQSFTAETAFEDIAQFFLYKGLRVGSEEINLTSGEIVTANYKFMGTEASRLPLQQSKLAAAPYTPLKATETEVVNATSNVANIEKNGQPLATAVKSMSYTCESNLREQRAVGSKFARGIGAGRFNISGKISAYFETGEMYDHFIEHDTIGIGFSVTDADSNVEYTTIPAIKITSDPVSPESGNADVMEEMDFEAQRDPETNCMIQWDRFSSTRPTTA